MYSTLMTSDTGALVCWLCGKFSSAAWVRSSVFRRSLAADNFRLKAVLQTIRHSKFHFATWHFTQPFGSEPEVLAARSGLALMAASWQAKQLV